MQRHIDTIALPRHRFAARHRRRELRHQAVRSCDLLIGYRSRNLRIEKR